MITEVEECTNDLACITAAPLDSQASAVVVPSVTNDHTITMRKATNSNAEALCAY